MPVQANGGRVTAPLSPQKQQQHATRDTVLNGCAVAAYGVCSSRDSLVMMGRPSITAANGSNVVGTADAVAGESCYGDAGDEYSVATNGCSAAQFNDRSSSVERTAAGAIHNGVTSASADASSACVAAGPAPAAVRGGEAESAHVDSDASAAVSNGVSADTALSASSAVISPPPLPWFGMDIGGTLAKLVYFEPSDFQSAAEKEQESETLKRIRKYLMHKTAYGETGHRDEHLQMDNVRMGMRTGTLHFIRFPTSEMQAFLELAKSKGMASLSSTICATGGGAYKFEMDFKKEVNLNLHKYDELDCLIHGIEHIEDQNPAECYYYTNPGNHNDYSTQVYDFSDPYPFLVVNIGSGVSILAVDGPDCFRRVSGTSLGGGTFLGEGGRQLAR